MGYRIHEFILRPHADNYHRLNAPLNYSNQPLKRNVLDEPRWRGDEDFCDYVDVSAVAKAERVEYSVFPAYCGVYAAFA